MFQLDWLSIPLFTKVLENVVMVQSFRFTKWESEVVNWKCPLVPDRRGSFQRNVVGIWSFIPTIWKLSFFNLECPLDFGSKQKQEFSENVCGDLIVYSHNVKVIIFHFKMSPQFWFQTALGFSENIVRIWSFIPTMWKLWFFTLKCPSVLVPNRNRSFQRMFVAIWSFSTTMWKLSFFTLKCPLNFGSKQL
jgi:hypothetical protein